MSNTLGGTYSGYRLKIDGKARWDAWKNMSVDEGSGGRQGKAYLTPRVSLQFLALSDSGTTGPTSAIKPCAWTLIFLPEPTVL